MQTNDASIEMQNIHYKRQDSESMLCCIEVNEDIVSRTRTLQPVCITCHKPCHVVKPLSIFMPAAEHKQVLVSKFKYGIITVILGLGAPFKIAISEPVCRLIDNLTAQAI